VQTVSNSLPTKLGLSINTYPIYTISNRRSFYHFLSRRCLEG